MEERYRRTLDPDPRPLRPYPGIISVSLFQVQGLVGSLMTLPSLVGSPVGAFTSVTDPPIRLFMPGQRVFALHAARLVLHS